MAFKHRLAIYALTWLLYGLVLLCILRQVSLEAGMSRTAESARMFLMLPFVFALGLVSWLAPRGSLLLAAFWLVVLLLAIHAILVACCRSRRVTLTLCILHTAGSLASAWGYFKFIQNVSDAP